MFKISDWLDDRAINWLERRAARQYREQALPPEQTTRASGSTNGVVDAPRVFFQWLWNSPGHEPLRPPHLTLVVDDLSKGRVLRWILSPAQAETLCNHGLFAIGEQMAQFGEDEAIDYDVRQMGVRFE